MLAFLLWGHAADASIGISYESGRGLSLSVQGISLVQGSYFQAYAPGWTKGYFNSQHTWQNVETHPDGSIAVTFDSKVLSGRADFSVDGSAVLAKYRFDWKGTESALMECSVGHFWGEPWGAPTVGQGIQFKGPIGSMKVESTGPDRMIAIDGRNNDNEWANRKNVYWVGWPDLKLEPGKTTTVSARIIPNVKPFGEAQVLDWKPTVSSLQTVLTPPPPHPALRKVEKPALAWRGVHLFVGPESRPIHKLFAEKVFPALGINKVVLQCERTDWLCQPGLKTALTTSREDLKAIFDTYRAHGIEPIPLIQSWGHMEWFFANNQNKELAFLPGGHYCIDPRNPAALNKVREIWKEAVALLHPKTIHFGLDEVQMEELPKDSTLVTAMWKQHLPWLGRLAQELGCTPMIWGDIALGKGEAPDANSFESDSVGPERRAAIPKGTFVADWHYLNDPDIAKYPSLNLFKKSGLRPIASTWFHDQNIFGFTQAAIKNEAEGTLQTNWNGYTLDAAHLGENIDHYSAMVLTAYYARTGDTTPPEKLGWSPAQAFSELAPDYTGDFRFRAPAIRRRRTGYCWTNGPATEVVHGRGITMKVGEPIEFDDPIGGKTGIQWLNLPIKRNTYEVVLALYCKHQLQPGDVVARFHVTAGDCANVQEIYYGRNICAPSDPSAPTHTLRDGKWAFARFNYDPEPLTSEVTVGINQVNPAAGIVIGGIAVIESK